MTRDETTTDVCDPELTRAAARVGITLRQKWHLDALLGAGGMAAVDAATHRNGSRVAIKILRPDLADDPVVSGKLSLSHAASRL
jgi:eukaryotic-like serine/threonine-protein kinase